MVYRQLQLAALAVGLCMACGESRSGGVSVALQLDTVSCGAGAESVELSCGGTLWIHVESADGSAIENACVDLGSNAIGFSSLAAILQAELNLGRLPANESLRIELAVFDQQLSQCPSEQGVLEPLIAGSTSLVVLAEVSEALTLSLACLQPVLPDFPDDPGSCDFCEIQVQQCLEQGRVGSCNSIFEACAENCADAGNGECNGCSLLDVRCEEFPQVTLDCQGFAMVCQDECINDPALCQEDCQRVETQCFSSLQIIDSCQQAGESCFEQCDLGGSSCLGLR